LLDAITRVDPGKRGGPAPDVIEEVVVHAR
jgi:hypothetical protein